MGRKTRNQTEFKYGHKYGYMYCTFESLIEPDLDGISDTTAYPYDTREIVEYSLMRDALEEQLDTLLPREALILRLRFFDELTLKQIGEICKVTPERIREIEAKALRKLRYPSRAKKLYPYLPEENQIYQSMLEEQDKQDVIRLKEYEDRCQRAEEHREFVRKYDKRNKITGQDYISGAWDGWRFVGCQ